MRLVCALLLTLPLFVSAQVAKRPKLVVAIAVDQFRYDYLVRFRDQYSGGLSRLLTQGAVFTNAHYEHFPTVTAIGHSTFLTGAIPSISGIIGNDWYDRETKKMIASIEDSKVQMLGGAGRAGKAASPRRLLVSTLGDELKMAGRGSKVIGISVKDRSAILPAGHMADGAYWYDAEGGSFVSSTYYFKELPAWARDFNQTRLADKYEGAEWKPVAGGTALKTMGKKSDAKYYSSLESTPYANELIEKFAESAIAGEQLGRRNATDVLTVSFSANDAIGHNVGPDDPQVKDISIRTDRLLADLFKYIDAQVGMRNVLVVFTADHGVAPLPELNQERRMPGGRVHGVTEAVTKRLTEKYGAGKWVEGGIEVSMYLDYDLIRSKKLQLKEVEETAAEAARELKHVFRVYTKDQLIHGAVPGDPIDKRILNGFNQQRSPDVIVLLDPYYLTGKTGTSHGTAFGYDTHVPVIFMGDGIRPGKYPKRVMVNDIAPTLAMMLEVETPSGAVGRALDEMFVAAAPK